MQHDLEFTVATTYLMAQRLLNTRLAHHSIAITYGRCIEASRNGIQAQRKASIGIGERGEVGARDADLRVGNRAARHVVSHQAIYDHLRLKGSYQEKGQQQEEVLFHIEYRIWS